MKGQLNQRKVAGISLVAGAVVTFAANLLAKKDLTFGPLFVIFLAVAFLTWLSFELWAQRQKRMHDAYVRLVTRLEREKREKEAKAADAILGKQGKKTSHAVNHGPVQASAHITSEEGVTLSSRRSDATLPLPPAVIILSDEETAPRETSHHHHGQIHLEKHVEQREDSTHVRTDSVDVSHRTYEAPESHNYHQSHSDWNTGNDTHHDSGSSVHDSGSYSND